jgi:hypothetical protein
MSKGGIMPIEKPQTGDPNTDAAITAFESELTRHCNAKNWPVVGDMLYRVSIMAEIAHEFYALDEFILETLFGEQLK